MIATVTSPCPACHNPMVAGSTIVRGPIGRYTHPVCPAAVSAPAFSGRSLTASDIGIYVANHDDTLVYRVRESSTNKGRFYAMKWVLIGGERATAAGTVQNGEYQFKDATGTSWTGRVARWLDAGKIHKMSELEAAHFSVLYGVCVMNPAHKLSAADSVDSGIGPVCAERNGWDQHAIAEMVRAERRAKLVEANPESRVGGRTYDEIFDDAPAPPAEIFLGTQTLMEGIASDNSMALAGKAIRTAKARRKALVGA